MKDYCINTKTGRVGLASPNLVKNKKIMLLSAESTVVKLYLLGVTAFKPVRTSTGNGWTFIPEIPPRWPEEKLAAVKDLIAGNKSTYDSAENDARLDPATVGVSVRDSEGGAEVFTETPVRRGMKYTVPEDFDVDIDVTTFDKGQMTALLTHVKGLTVTPGMKVQGLRKLFLSAMEHIRTVGNGVELMPEGARENKDAFVEETAEQFKVQHEAKGERRADAQGAVGGTPELPTEPTEIVEADTSDAGLAAAHAAATEDAPVTTE